MTSSTPYFLTMLPYLLDMLQLDHQVHQLRLDLIHANSIYPIGEASIFIEISKTSLYVKIFYYMKGILICSTNATMNHSLCCTSLIPKLDFSIIILNRWSKSQTDSFGYFFISFSSMIYCDLDLGFLNSSINPFLIFARVFCCGTMGTYINFMYQSNVWPRKVVTNWPFFISSFKTFLVV